MLDIFRDISALPANLIRAIKTLPGMDEIYESRVRHYVLEDHTRMVVEQFDRYFGDILLPFDRAIFRWMLIVHDIGKPLAAKEKDLSRQYFHTKALIRNIRPEIPFSNENIDVCLAIIGSDPLGQWFQDQLTLTQTKDIIQQAAIVSGLPIKAFFKAITIYYQCDVAAYTKDAGGLPFLEKVFLYNDGLKVLDKKRKILRFSPIFETKYHQLETVLL